MKRTEITKGKNVDVKSKQPSPNHLPKPGDIVYITRWVLSKGIVRGTYCHAVYGVNLWVLESAVHRGSVVFTPGVDAFVTYEAALERAMKILQRRRKSLSRLMDKFAGMANDYAMQLEQYKELNEDG